MNQHVVVVGIEFSCDGQSQAFKGLVECLVGPEMSKAYGDVMVYPNMFFVDGAGTIVTHLAGPHDAVAIEAAARLIEKP